ncbi:hypothetical protein [Pontibacter silvestris]|uniref:hypothetical protein n=1 Tax=Pontibacter silvestris TaxID=2305183 RepID=UPI001E358E6C|nr:hypothetical protein [Pontibacter silvestris]MCC9138808.1 hypothetical protein [Pontibacter silvestris]
MKNENASKGKLAPAKVNKMSEKDMNQVLGGQAAWPKISLTICSAVTEAKEDSDGD